ncbi:MAG TPA: homoserine O-succinyltransferase [Caulobacteraceae bacterium]|jgi:homoserine O-succinyltransferase|nr:homoserine O-succinyltransferase [Caulobacteraceae bacterium]
MGLTTFHKGPTFAAQMPTARAPRLKIGLLNNMPDAAMATTERQFSSLLQVAAEGAPVTLKLFALAGVTRGEAAQLHMRGRYLPAEALADAGLDGLIVTGAEPRTPDLEQEPYWPALTRVIDWVEHSGVPTIWSCLAAHAAVRHLSRIRRQPLAAKLSGVFETLPAREDPLLAGVTTPLHVPHSRQNGLVEDDLVEKGYRVLTRAPAVGVDAFVKRGIGLSLYFQGHPEYDADTLMREYSRDVGRFLNGKRPHHPNTPAGYFDLEVEAALAEVSFHARRRPHPKFLPFYAAILAKAAPTRTWRGTSVKLYRNWLRHIAAAARPTPLSSVSLRVFPPPPA